MEQMLTAVAGDDFTLAVDFSDGKAPIALSEQDSIQLVIHGDGRENRYSAAEIRNHTAFFCLSGEETERLSAENPGGRFTVCVRLVLASGGRSTPVYRKPLLMVRC